MAFVAVSAPVASADTIGWGIPVSAGNATGTPVGFPVGSDHVIQYYIPLEGDGSGTYGVTVTPDGIAGMVADTGNGSSNAYLDMWLKFQPVAPLPLATANLLLTFWDLDLANINDPIGFFETFQLFSSNGTALSSVFTYAAPSGDADGKISGTLDVNPNPSVTEPINWTLTRALGSAGATAPSTLEFYGSGLASRITDPFYARLRFAVPEGAPTGTNTAEYLTAKLTTTSQSVPEPGSALLLGLGLTGAMAVRRRLGRAE
jgi:hypothetical protein